MTEKERKTERAHTAQFAHDLMGKKVCSVEMFMFQGELD